jgi:hypothetical protein
MSFITHAKAEVMNESVKHAPGITVGGSTLFGVPLPDLVLYATLTYYLLLLGLKVWDRFIKPHWKKSEQTSK